MKRQHKLKTAETMLRIFCRAKHGKRPLCPSCSELLAYVAERLEQCPLPEEHSSCFMCPDYCYNSDMRTKVKAVMIFSGPRILLYHPVLTFRHLHQLKKLHRPL